MKTKLEREHKALLRKWATGSATPKQVARCMELDRKRFDVAKDGGKSFNGMNRSANINPFHYAR